MVRIDLLDPFETFRTRPPIIMPETEGARKKNEAFMVLAPSIEKEFSYLSEIDYVKFRYLMKYFIDKKWDITLYGQGHKVINLNADGEITKLLDAHQSGNLKNVTEITSYLPTVKSRVLRDFNVLVECNYATDMILNNEKDRRLLPYRVNEWLKELIRIRSSATIDGYLGNYTTNILIPMNLWFDTADYTTPAALLKRTSKNPMGLLLAKIAEPSTLKALGRVILVHDSFVVVLDPDKIPDGSDPDFIMTAITQFMMKAKKAKDVFFDTTEDSEISDDEIAIIENIPEGKKPTEEQRQAAAIKKAENEKKLSKAEQQTTKSAVAEKVMEKAAIDPDNLSKEQKQKVEDLIIKNVSDDNIVNSNEPGEIDVRTSEVVIQHGDEVDELLAAKAEGKSLQSYRRDQMLKEKYKDLKMGDIRLDDILKVEESTSIPETKVDVKTINPAMKNIKADRFDETYNKALAERDLTNILLHFSHVHPALYLTKDIKVEDVSTPTDRVLRYTVEFEDENRKRHRFSFKLPKMYQDKYFYLNDQKVNLVYQKFPYPVTKVSPDRCQAVSNYKKIFTSRYGGNLSPRITRLKKIFSSPDCPRVVKATKGDATILNKTYLTTVEYDEIGSNILRLMIGKDPSDMYKIFFVYNDALAEVDTYALDSLIAHKAIEGSVEDYIPLGIHIKNKIREAYYLNAKTNIVYDYTGKTHGELSEFIVEICGQYDKTFQNEMANTSPGTKFVYSRSRVMACDIPTVLAISAADPGGLQAVLEKSKMNWEFVEKRPTVDKDQKGIIQFSDGYLVFDRYPFENSLLLNGLNTFPTKEYSFYDMNNRDTYVDIFDGMFGSRTLIDGLQNFYYMFIDPITMDVLIRLKMPTDFTSLMLYCNDVLADNNYQVDSNYNNCRLRSNEIVYAYLYMELADAWGYYRIGKTEKFSIPEDAVIKDLVTANIVDPHSELNVVLEMENDRQVKAKGPSGMNEDHSFTLEKRAYHPTMQGIIGMNSTPSGEVGIARHLTLNSNITDARGFLKVDPNEDYDGTELTTPGEMMQAFGPESADIERVAMSISQSKHVVPVADSCSSPVSYDMERIVPYLSKDYARTAKQDGKVVALENQVMIIQYKDGSYDDVDLSEHPAKNTDGGFYIMNQMSTDLKVGDKVKEGQLIAYDKKYMNNADMFGDPLANMGTMARVALETNGGVYEDSCYITNSLAHRMATKITRQKRVILSRFANIKYMAKVGQHINTNDPLLTFDDTQDEFTSQMLQAMADETGDDDEIIATNAPVVSKISGVIKDIRIYYTVDLDEMTPSLRKIVEDYNKPARQKEKTLAKYMNVYDANTIIRSSEKLIPDSTGKVKGVKLDGVMIDFYIEYLDIMAPGDKLSFSSVGNVTH